MVSDLSRRPALLVVRVSAKTGFSIDDNFISLLRKFWFGFLTCLFGGIILRRSFTPVHAIALVTIRSLRRLL